MKVSYSDDSAKYPRLTLGETYEVIGVEADSYRIVNDENDPCLYEPEYFKIVDSEEPVFWVNEYGDDGERYAYPPEWNRVGFFEDYHDRIESVRTQFWKELQRYYPQ